MSRMRGLLAWMRSGIRAKERGASLVEYALLIGLIAVVLGTMGVRRIRRHRLGYTTST